MSDASRLKVGILNNASVYVESIDGGFAIARAELTPDEARAVAAELLRRADQLEADGFPR